jgi:hypothetical protein
VYVADLGNSRIDEFSSSGNFIKAWGWGVSDGQSQLETCTSSCQAGLNGGGAGEMSTPKWVAADSSGDIYVSDYANHRIEHFTSAGSFVEAWGWGVADGQSMFETCTNSCEPGLYGAGAGELALPEGLAADSSNDVYVADFDLNRIDQFAGSSASAASITSANTTRFTVGTAGSFTVTASGYPTPSLSESGPLPTGVSFHDNGDGNATLSGTPASGTGGSYPLTITAHNGVGSDATQSFTLTVDQPAAITSASTTRFTVGTADSFTVTASGYPTPSLSESGTLPTGVSFHDDGDASATISGTPSRKAVGTYNLTLMAKNGIGADATQSFTLVVAKKKK